jgi:hypothetical protein
MRIRADPQPFEVSKMPSRATKTRQGKVEVRSPKARIFKPSKLTIRERALQFEWEDRAEKLSVELEGRVSTKGRSPTETWTNHLIREAYRLVRELRGRRRGVLESVLLYKIASPGLRAERRSVFSLNFEALGREANLNLTKQRRSDYSQALEYADKHDIPPELLLGFITQVGGIKAACEKLGEGRMEEWFNPQLPWLPGS